MNPNRFAARVLFVCLFVISSFCGLGYCRPLAVAPAEAVGISGEKLDLLKPAVQKFVDDNKIAGASVLVARKGKVVFEETFGMMDIAAGKRIEKDTIFRIYSMTKPITSVAVMMLFEEDKVQLDEPVSKYLPEFKGLKVYDKSGNHVEPTRAMTVRDLLRHTSGLTYGIFGNTPVDKMYRSKNVLSHKSSATAMTSKLGQIPLQYQPGTKWHYSVSTDVLGCLVEKVSGKGLGEFFQERIFEPLDMKDSAFFVAGDKADRFAACYGPDRNGGLFVNDNSKTSRFLTMPGLCSGGGGLCSTGRDYMRFCQMLLNEGELDGKRLLRKETIKIMTKDQLPEGVDRGWGNGFGLGFSVRTANGRSPKGEYGWGGAASTHFWISPKDELIVIALSQYMPYSHRLENTIKPIVYKAIIN